jgi:hypothetical protein
MGILGLVQKMADQIGVFILRLSFSGCAGPITDVLPLDLEPYIHTLPLLTTPGLFQVPNF